jgi:hypothetical protein
MDAVRAIAQGLQVVAKQGCFKRYEQVHFGAQMSPCSGSEFTGVRENNGSLAGEAGAVEARPQFSYHISR